MLAILLATFAAGTAELCLGQRRSVPVAAAAAATAWTALAILAVLDRPVLAGVAATLSGLTVTVVSCLKHRYLGEPLVLPDFAFLPDIPRHPRLFYLTPVTSGLLVGLGAALVAATVAFLMWEPPLLTGAGQGALALVCALPLLLLLAPGPARRRLAGSVRRAGFGGEPRHAFASLGTFGLLAAQAVLWLEQPVPAAAAPVRPAAGLDAIVVIQAESFVDLRRFGRGGPDLPAFADLKACSRLHGLLAVPAQGAYTVRTECAVLTGLGFAELGVDGCNPYLRPGRLAGHAIPAGLKAAGWRTIFVHPYDGAFYRRDRVLPQIGFERFLDEAAFPGAARTGLFVADASVGERLLAELDAAVAEGRKAFLFAATMEAHDPYGPGRLPGEDDPVRQYEIHLRNADAMIGAVVRGIEARGLRALLVVYGDHVPSLPDMADRFPDPRTDYAVVLVGDAAPPAGPERFDTTPEGLSCRLREMI